MNRQGRSCDMLTITTCSSIKFGLHSGPVKGDLAAVGILTRQVSQQRSTVYT